MLNEIKFAFSLLISKDAVMQQDVRVLACQFCGASDMLHDCIYSH